MTLFFSQRHGKYQSMNSLMTQRQYFGLTNGKLSFNPDKETSKRDNVLKISS